MAYKVSVVSLGCPKNQVDAEMMLAALLKDGFELSAEEAAADAIIINTCGFIEEAKSEEEFTKDFALKIIALCKDVKSQGSLTNQYFVQQLA